MTVLAAFLALALAGGAPAEIALTAQKPVSKAIDAFPHIAAPATAETAAINAALARGDERVRNAARDCQQSDPDRGEWNRTVSAPFRYGAYVTVVAADDWYCGGPYPDAFTLPLTYDVTTGAPIDWTKLFPARIAGEPVRGAAGDATVVGELESPILGEIYRRKVLLALDEDGRRDCAEIFDRDLPLMLWLDAQREAVVMKTTAFPHAAAACAQEATLSLTELPKLSASPALVDMIKAAHDAHAWTASFPRRK